MIEIKADSEKIGNERGAEVTIKINADNEKTATKELYVILKALDSKCPKILMGAVEMHIKDIIVNETDDISAIFKDEGRDYD